MSRKLKYEYGRIGLGPICQVDPLTRRLRVNRLARDKAGILEIVGAGLQGCVPVLFAWAFMAFNK